MLPRARLHDDQPHFPAGDVSPCTSAPTSPRAATPRRNARETDDPAAHPAARPAGAADRLQHAARRETAQPAPRPRALPPPPPGRTTGAADARGTSRRPGGRRANADSGAARQERAQCRHAGTATAAGRDGGDGQGHGRRQRTPAGMDAADATACSRCPATSTPRTTPIATPTRCSWSAEQPVSTFSIDVDTGSYTNVRRMLNAGPAAAGRCGARGGVHQLLRLRLHAAGRSRAAVQRHHRAGAGAVERESPAAAGRHPGLPRAEGTDSRRQPGVPDRHLRLDERAGQAAAAARPR